MVCAEHSLYAQQDGERESKRGILSAIAKPFKWIADNWSAKDTTYCYDTFYNWAGQVQDNLSQEYLRLESSDGMKIEMHSKRSNKIGPYLGYSFLFAGATFDFLAHSETNRRDEFTLRINSQLANIDIIRRRTGGDFRLDDFMVGMYGSVADFAPKLNELTVGDNIHYDVTGININYFTNHLRFSNPAAYSNGALQLRSAGSPIVGLGITHQKMESDFFEKKVLPAIDDDATASFSDEAQLSLLFGQLPEKINIYDYHLQLGYAYNLVLSKRLLLSASLVVSPSFKHVYIDLAPTWYYGMLQITAQEGHLTAEELHEKTWELVRLSSQELYPTSPVARYVNENQPTLQELGPEHYHTHAWGMNTSGRASLTYTHDHWRAGVVANYNGTNYHKDGVHLDNKYWDASLYVGYCFGLKKDYRKGGKHRQAYLRLAGKK